MSALIDDLRQAFRVLGKSPGFAAASLFMLALAIGANTAIFTVIDAVLLRPLPFPQPQQLVRITADLTGRGARNVGVGAMELFDYQQQADLFTAASGEYPINANLTGGDEPERLEAQLVSVSYFSLLGAQARLGRVFGADDYTAGITEIAVISDGLWKRRFGADPQILGRKIRIDNDLFTIIGVMPPGFRHPGLGIAGDAELWAPTGYRALPFNTPRRGFGMLSGALARLRPGVTVASAQARLDALGDSWRRDYPDAYPREIGWRPRVIALQEDLAGPVRPALWLLLGAVGMVLLIACANVANLLLARASARRREFAIRIALGARAGRVVRQLLTESIVLSLAAGLLGVLVASWSLRALIQLAPADAPLIADATIDARVLLFSVLVSMATGVIFGLVPARQAARTDPQDVLRDTGRGSTSGAATHRWRHALVMAEFALALMLLVGASLLVRGFTRLYAIDPGFAADRVLTARLWMPQPNDPATGPYFTHPQRLRLYRQALDRITARPDVEAAGWVTRLPLDGAPRGIPMTIEGRSLETAEASTSETYLASAGYFQTLRIPLARGRLFTDRDNSDAPLVALINERFARTFFPGEDPINRRVRLGRGTNTGPLLTIVGVVKDVRTGGLDTVAAPQLYRCVWQSSGLVMALVVRTRANGADAGTAALGDSIRRDVQAVDAELPLFAVRPMTTVMAQATAQRRFSMVLLGLFAGTAVLLAAVGIYAMMAYLVRQRTHEIGIRLALGARPGDAIGLIVRRGMALTLGGAAIGLAGAVLVTQVLRGLFVGVSTADPLSFAAPAIALTTVSLLACYLPARRAARIDPIVTMKAE
jgi:putative ABC transport system permease protein